MKYRLSLANQNFILAIAIFSIILISLGFILPKTLVPIYEKILYQYLSEPLVFLDDTSYNNLETNIAYLYADNQTISYSDNLSKIIKLSPKKILEEINDNYGKFKYYGKTYYYSRTEHMNVIKIAITDDSYVETMASDILIILMPILLLTFLFVLALMMIWSRRMLLKIGYLRRKIENFNNDNFHEEYTYHVDDELRDLSVAIDNMQKSLKEEEEYKNQMYQNISHDFKTPLTVIKSYIEGIEDGIQQREEGIEVIKNQVDKLEKKVHSLLYLNKLSYIKDTKQFKKDRVDISEVIRSSAEKFKLQRSDVQWKIIIADKKLNFCGTFDMWEAIIDNILSNFMRYAEKEIKITVKNNRITFYNDGPNIDDNILNDVFTPYKKGTKGQFGLGLSVVKKSLSLLGYEISVKNEKKGISFTIK